MEPRCHPRAGTVSLNSFSASLREQIVHFHVTRLMDSLYLWAGATPHLRDLAVAMSRRDRSGLGAERSPAEACA
uniref:Proteasome assembly chaperone 4 n=1 Tax=Catagonus wagneri TaxID=51154 RepID=A0A8C3YVZ0_9CETA